MQLFKMFFVVLGLSGVIALFPADLAAEEPVAAIAASTDVEATMKEMAFAYKKAMAATEVTEAQQQITQLQRLVQSVQLVTFSPEKQPKFQQGLSEVQAQLDLVQVSLSENNLPQAKQQLLHVDMLKKQYHKVRSPSFWQLLFGN